MLLQGLAGLEIGRQLLYRTCQAVHLDVPGVEKFLTMSPIPGFLPWLRRCVATVAGESVRSSYIHNPDGTTGAVEGTESESVGDCAMYMMLSEKLEGLQSEPYRQVLLERLFFTEEDREAGTCCSRIRTQNTEITVIIVLWILICSG